MINKCTLFLIILFSIRSFSGGFHANTTIGCFFLSYFLYIVNIFLTKEEAENYIPIFLKNLVNDNNIDKNILSDQKLADEYIKTAVWPLRVSKLEIMKDE